jgi:MFS transporter, DHA1 family, multidrug resistance protein
LRSEALMARLSGAALPREAWKRNQLAVNIAAGLVYFGFTLVMPFLPLYVAELGVRGVGPIALWSGILLSAPPLLAAVLGPFWGRVGDRYGMKLMVGRVLVTMTLTWALMYFATSIYHVLALRLFLGVFSGFAVISAALVTQACPPERIGRAIGTLQATQILSTAVGPFAGGLLFALAGIRRTFLITSACCLIALALILVLYRDAEREAERETRPALGAAGGWRSEWKAMSLLPGFLPILPFLFLVNLVDRTYPTVIPLLMQSMIGDLPEKVAAVSGVIVTSHSLAAALSAYLVGRLAAAWRPGPLLAGILSAAVLVGLLIAGSRTPGEFLLLRIAAGLLTGGAVTLGYTVGGAAIPAERRATYYGILSSTALLGGAVGPLGGGLLAGLALRAPLYFSALIYLALLPWVFRRLFSLPAVGKPPDPAVLQTRPLNQA